MPLYLKADVNYRGRSLRLLNISFQKEISCVLHIRTELGILIQIDNLISGEAEAMGYVVGPCLPSLPDKQDHLDCCAAVPCGLPVLRSVADQHWRCLRGMSNNLTLREACKL